jgi:cyclopropane fatty-acyl-phospholipid synthase-like methyltransferase
MPSVTRATPPPGAYTEDYYHHGVEGHEQFAATGGRAVSPRLARALRLARIRSGMRVLDIACGRGEVVLQSAMRRTEAVGIDYAHAAVRIAYQTLAGAPGTDIARMDATKLAFARGAFDVAFMLDFVEHVHQPDLEASVSEVWRVLKPGGRLVVHTSPNRVFEEQIYPYYVRNVHRALLLAARVARLEGNRFFNKLVLPTGRLPPHDEYERTLHVNPQSAPALRGVLLGVGFDIERVDFWEPPRGRFFPDHLLAHRIGLAVLDALRFLRPVSNHPPLNRFFSNHIWIVARR